MKKSLLFLLVVMMITQIVSIEAKALTDKEYACELSFSVDIIDEPRNVKNVGCFASYNEAKAQFDKTKATNANAVIRSKDSKAPMKIVAMTNGAVVANGGTTVNIYKNRDLNDNGGITTYVSNNSQMHYYGSEVNSAGSIVYKVNVSGYTGYISSALSDLIPLNYMTNQYVFTIRTNNGILEEYKTNKEYYEVVKNASNQANELYFRYYTPTKDGRRISIGPIGLAPDFMKPGQKYYTDNHTNFYSDITLRTPVNNGNKYLNYYTFLPFRSKSNYTAQDFKKYLEAVGRTNSAYYDQTQAFIDGQNKYAMNALLVFALANHESAYGTSTIAREKYNYFGWGAVDSSPFASASSYATKDASILQAMSINLFGYSNPLDWRFSGPAAGNKGAGANTKYASDMYWGLKVAGHAYQIDRAFGYKDYQQYALGLLPDATNVNVRNQANANATILYHTNGSARGGLINQTVAITQSVGNFYEVFGWYPIQYGEAIKAHNNGWYEVDINKSVGYIDKSLVTPLTKVYYSSDKSVDITKPTDSVKPEEPAKPDPVVTEEKVTVKIIPDVGLILRKDANTDSTRLTVLPKGTQVEGTYTADKQWIKVTYGGQTGYIFAQYTEVIKQTTPTNPANPTVKLGDVNGDNKINAQDYVLIANHILGKKKLTGNAITSADINKDSKINAQDYVLVANHILGKSQIR